MTIKSDSDYVAGALANYTSGIGYYTSHTEVSDLLQVGAFTSSSTPSIATVGKIIKRVEGRIDESIKLSYRPEIIEKETHNFDAWQLQSYPLTYWKDYVGFIQLNSTKIQKIIRLEVYKGDAYEDLASAMVEYTPPADAVNGAFTITLGVGSDADTGYRFVLTKGQANGFYDLFGQETTVKQICDAINEKYPADTARFTGETSIKEITDAPNGGGVTRNISDFFYASPSHNGTSVKISSLLPKDAGTICTITATHGTTSSSSFDDKENYGRREDFWTLDGEGKIFFRQDYPYLMPHSVKVTYIRGSKRVPASIHEAATKMVAAEILVHDDNTILINETGANIDLKTKHDILMQEAKAIIDGKKQLIHFID